MITLATKLHSWLYSNCHFVSINIYKYVLNSYMNFSIYYEHIIIFGWSNRSTLVDLVESFVDNYFSKKCFRPQEAKIVTYPRRSSHSFLPRVLVLVSQLVLRSNPFWKTCLMLLHLLVFKIQKTARLSMIIS